MQERDIIALKKLSKNLLAEFDVFTNILLNNNELSTHSDADGYGRAVDYHSECASLLSFSSDGLDYISQYNAIALDQLIESCFKSMVNGMTYYLIEMFPEDPQAKHLPEKVTNKLKAFGAAFQNIRGLLDAIRTITGQYVDEDFSETEKEEAQIGVLPQEMMDKMVDSKRRLDRLVEVNKAERRSMSLIDESKSKSRNKGTKGEGVPGFFKVLFGDMFKNIFKK